jgi:hypothetical protein
MNDVVTAIALVGLLGLPAPVPLAARTRQTPAPCSSEAFHSLDFWIGRWTVTTANGQPAGTSVVEAVSGGCAVLERYAGPGPYRGTGVHVFNPAGQTWHQYWTDNRPAIVDDMRGQATAGAFVYRWDVYLDPKGQPGRRGDTGVRKIPKRYTLTKENEAVRQIGERSMDDGKTWIVEFDYVYHRAA